MEPVVLKVASGSNPKLVAGSISHVLKGNGEVAGQSVIVKAIGAKL